MSCTFDAAEREYKGHSKWPIVLYQARVEERALQFTLRELAYVVIPIKNWEPISHATFLEMCSIRRLERQMESGEQVEDGDVSFRAWAARIRPGS